LSIESKMENENTERRERVEEDIKNNQKSFKMVL